MGDRELRHDILDELELEPGLDTAGIAVAVADGIVTLTGAVGTLGDRIAAREIAASVVGVRAVADELEVRPTGAGALPDEELARRVLEVLSWTAAVPAGRVQVTVSGGTVTLEGDVDWRYQAEAAERAIRWLAGVTGIDGRLRILPSVRPEDVSERIRKALQRDAELDARHIAVRVEGSRVILEGRVRHPAERRSAERAAWSAPGVTEVIDRLTVT